MSPRSYGFDPRGQPSALTYCLVSEYPLVSESATSAMAAERQTFLFTDLVGFTALTEANGDDGAAELALDFYSRVRSLLVAHDAEEVKTIGDAMMLHCDDAGAGIRLGLKIVDALEAVPGFPAVRVGMDTGSAVERDGDWYGATVNVAARLCAAAGGGQVLVSETTERAAGRLRKIRLGDPELHWLKNVSEPVSARLAFEHECRFTSERLRTMKLFADIGVAP
jgi:adenylate cyclase